MGVFFSRKFNASLNQDVKDKKGLSGLYLRLAFGLYEPPSVDLILGILLNQGNPVQSPS